jgi:PTS system nitrogen regulatory IIA component
MKLTVSETAKLLGTTDAAVYRWIRQDAIPCHRVNDTFRFHKAELLEWATARGMLISADAFPASRRAVDRSRDGFSAALRAVVARMPIDNEADRDLLVDVLLAREALGSTGVGDGIAIPHVRSPVVLPSSRPAISLCFLTNPIEFQAIDDRPVHTFFSLVTLNVRSHLYLLSRLSAMLQDPQFKQAILDRARAEVILAEAERVDLTAGVLPVDP